MTGTSGHLPGAGFGDFVLVAIAVAFLVGMVRDLRAHPEVADGDDGQPIPRRQRRPGSRQAAEAAAPTRWDRARRRARQGFRRFRSRSWLRRRILPGEPGAATAAGVLGDSVAGAFAVFAYAAGFAAGLAHAKNSTSPAGAGKGTEASRERPGTGQDSGDTGHARPDTEPPKTWRTRLAAVFRRRPPEAEVVDPTPIKGIGTARDTDVIDAEVLDDTTDPTPETDPDPTPYNATNPAQGARPMAFIQTIFDLFRWVSAAVKRAEAKASDAEMRAKVAAARAADAIGVAESAAQEAATLSQLYDYWSTQNVDSSSLNAIANSAETARLVLAAEKRRAECEQALADANVNAVKANRSHAEGLVHTATTVKARQEQHAQAQADTGNAAAAPTVLEGA